MSQIIKSLGAVLAIKSSVAPSLSTVIWYASRFLFRPESTNQIISAQRFCCHYFKPKQRNALSSPPPHPPSFNFYLENNAKNILYPPLLPGNNNLKCCVLSSPRAAALLKPSRLPIPADENVQLEHTAKSRADTVCVCVCL